MMRKICVLVLLLLLLLLLLPPVRCWDHLRNPSYVEIWSSVHKWDREEARAFCLMKFTDLLTIRHEDENGWLKHYSGWFGLYREGTGYPWRWTKGDAEASFFAWRHDDPDDGDNCARKYAFSLEWYSGLCHNWNRFLCSEDRVILVKEEKTWEEALAHCRSLEALDPSRPAQDFKNHRYDLVSILNQDDVQYVREKAQGATTDEVWTGLRFMAGYWLWVDGALVLEGQQIPSQPTPGSLNFCGTLGVQSNGSVQAGDCALRKNFMCYKQIQDRILEMY